MSGSTRTSADLDDRRKRILFRSWHRGIREMDLIMGGFADVEIAQLTDDELDEFESLIEVPDRDLYSWISGAAATPETYDRPVFRKLRAFHTHDAPIHD